MYAPLFPITGMTPFNDWFVCDTTQRHPLGYRIMAADPYWGFGEFMYYKSTDAIIKGSVIVWDESMNAVLVPSTTLQGFPVGVAMAPAATGVYGWMIVSGLAVYKTSATVAADANVAIAAAGVVGASATGKQLVGVRNRKAATATTVLTNVGTQSGNGILTTNGYDGWFLGMALSGTGIPASTVVAALNPDGRTVYTGSAIGTLGDKNSTATGSVSVTGTYTGYGAGQINHPFAQGAIT